MKRATDHLEPSAKRRQDRQGRKGDEDESSDEGDVDPGHFDKAPEEVLKTRRIVKARRGGGVVASSTPAPPAGLTSSEAPEAANSAPEPAVKSSNPFAGINLVAPQAMPQAKAEAPSENTETPVPEATAPAKPAEGELGSKDAITAQGDAADDAVSVPEGASHARPPAPSTPPTAGDGNGDAQPSVPQTEPPAGQPDSDGGAAPAAGDAAAADAAAAATGVLAGDATAAAATAGGAVDKKGEGSPPGATVSGSASTVAPTPSETSKPALSGFGASLAAKTGTSGFGSLAGAAASKPFGFGAVQPPSDGQGFGTKPAVFGGAFGRAPSAGSTDVPAPQSVFGSKPAVTSGAAAATGDAKAAADAKAEEDVVTGEEGERTVWTGDGTLFEFSDGAWRERGRGQARVNVTSTGSARIVMRQRGNLRLLLNANLWSDMAVNRMDGGLGVTFALHNAATDASNGEGAVPAEGATKPALSTFAFRTKTQQTLTDLTTAIETHK